MTLALDKDGRKYTICLLALVIATVAMFLRFCAFEAWSYFTLGDLAIYAGANVVKSATAKAVAGRK
jgi:hypothetical protein